MAESGFTKEQIIKIPVDNSREKEALLGIIGPVLMEDGNPNQVYEEAKQAVQEVKAEEDGQDPDNGQAQEEGQPAAAALPPAEAAEDGDLDDQESQPPVFQAAPDLMDLGIMYFGAAGTDGRTIRLVTGTGDFRITLIHFDEYAQPDIYYTLYGDTWINDQEQDPEAVDSQVFQKEGTDIMNISGGYFRLPVKGLDK